MSEVKEEVKEEATEVSQKGFTLLIDEQGTIKLTPINLSNDFELVGMVDYAYQKKNEILQTIAKSPEVRTVSAVSQLTGLLSQIFQNAEGMVKTGEVAKA